MLEIFNGVSIGDTVSFSVFENTIIPNNYVNVKAVGLVDYDLIRSVLDARAIHANIYPALPSTVINDPTQYYYIKFVTASGESVYLGRPWIRDDTITVTGSSTLTITINNASPEIQQSALEALSANGISISNIALV